MNELVVAFVIAFVQGLTEWLPISSSGHLVLVDSLFGFSGGLALNVGVHFGTLLAVLVYFWGDVWKISSDFLKGNWKSGEGKVGWYLIVATLPAAIIGFLFRDFFEVSFLGLDYVVFGFLFTGIFLMVASFEFSRERGLGLGIALAIGVAQVFALFPGVSRSGMVIGAALLLGLSEKGAMRFGFLMAIPIILGASVLSFVWQGLTLSLLLAVVVSFLVGVATIHLLYDYILTSRKNLVWFGAYAILLGILLLVF